MTLSAPPTSNAVRRRSPVSGKFLLGLLLPLVTAAMAFAQSAMQNASPQSSEEMKAIFLADQFDRGNNPYAKPGDPQPPSLPGAQLRKNDDARDLRVQAMIREGVLQTGIDFFRAALVFNTPVSQRVPCWPISSPSRPYPKASLARFGLQPPHWIAISYRQANPRYLAHNSSRCQDPRLRNRISLSRTRLIPCSSPTHYARSSASQA